jgi:hypothetical protein
VGIQVAAEATHLSKLHFRRAQAREQLRRPREAAEDMRRAHEDTQVCGVSSATVGCDSNQQGFGVGGR